MTEVEYLEQILSTVQMYGDDIAIRVTSVIAMCGGIAICMFALSGCLIGFFSGIELLKIWR